MSAHPYVSVSIHAPVKGATNPEQMREQVKRVSIHAPVKGATSMLAGCCVIKKFQSTRP